MRRIALSVAASAAILSLAGCGVLNATGDSTSASPAKGNDLTVGLLLPEKTNTRYDKFDYPIIKSKVADLTATTPEDAVTLAELLDTVDEPAYLAAKAASAFSSSGDVIAALVALSALRADENGYLTADPVLLADVPATR